MSLVGRTFDVFLLGSKAIELGYRKQFRELKRKNQIYNEKVKEFIQERLQEIKKSGVTRKDVIS